MGFNDIKVQFLPIFSYTMLLNGFQFKVRNFVTLSGGEGKTGCTELRAWSMGRALSEI